MKREENQGLVIGKNIFAFFLFLFGAYFQYIPIRLFSISREQLLQNERLSILLSVFSSIVILFCYLLLYRKELIREAQIFFKNWRDHLDVGFACWISGLIIMFLSNLILVSVFHSGGANNENAIREMTEVFPLMMGLDACLLAPIVEEIAFRKTLKNIFQKPVLFIFFSFLFFGGAHVLGMAQNFVDLLYIIPYGALGATFAYAYWKTDTVFTSISFHMIHNTITVLLTTFLF